MIDCSSQRKKKQKKTKPSSVPSTTDCVSLLLSDCLCRGTMQLGGLIGAIFTYNVAFPMGLITGTGPMTLDILHPLSHPVGAVPPGDR